MAVADTVELLLRLVPQPAMEMVTANTAVVRMAIEVAVTWVTIGEDAKEVLTTG